LIFFVYSSENTLSDANLMTLLIFTGVLMAFIGYWRESTKKSIFILTGNPSFNRIFRLDHIYFNKDILNEEVERSNALLDDLLPSEISTQYKKNPGLIAFHHDKVSVLLMDIVGFTAMAARMSPSDVVCCI
jgi:hypothetical protein